MSKPFSIGNIHSSNSGAGVDELQLMQKLFKNIPGVIFQFQLFDDSTFCFSYISNGVSLIFGLSSEEVMADPSILFAKIHPEDKGKLFLARNESINNLSNITVDLRFLFEDDLVKWININSTPERLQNCYLWNGYIREITAEKEKELLIEVSEKRYRDIVEQSLNAFIIGKGGALIDANPAAVQMFGYDSIEDIKRVKRENLIDDKEERYAELRLKRNINGKVNGEITGIRRNGERFPCYFSSTQFVEKDDSILTMSFYIDLSEIQKAEEKLAKSQQLLSQAEAIAHIGSSEVDYKTGKFLWSDEFYRIHGLEPNSCEPTPELSESFLHPDEKYKVDIFNEAPLKKVENLNFDSKIIRADGKVREVSSSWKLIYDSKGNPVKMYGVVQDITDKKQLETALKLSEEQFRGAFEYSAIGIAIADSTKKLTVVNDTLCNMLGFEREELLQLKFTQLTHPEDLKLDLRNLKDLEEGKRSFYKMEKRYFHKDGSTIWVLLIVSMIKHKEGKAHQFVAQIENITQRKEQETVLQKLNEELALRANELMDSNKELERFAYIVSHDLQEPLRMVTSFLQLIEKKYGHQLDDKAREYISYAVGGAKRMKDLILDMLEFSRVSSSIIKYEQVDLLKTVEEVKLNLLPHIQNDNATIIVGNLPKIKCIRSQMFQLMQNLIGNALKYKHRDREAIVEISSIEHDTEWEIKISDNGIGIDAKYFEKIFVIFQRLHTKSDYSGTGIGLAICKKIVDRHYGRIWVESELGKGSSFIFAIPKE